MSFKETSYNTSTQATTNTENRYLCFSVGNEDYAIPLLSVKEVIADPKTTPLPYSPSHFRGLMNLRGQVISIIDLRLKLGVKPKDKKEESAVIIIDMNPVYVGIGVDSVNNVLLLGEKDVSPPPEMENRKVSRYLRGVARKDDRLILLVQIEHILDLEDKAIINKQSKTHKKVS